MLKTDAFPVAFFKSIKSTKVKHDMNNENQYVNGLALCALGILDDLDDLDDLEHVFHSHDGSMVLLYMVRFTIHIYIYTPNVSIYTSTMDPSWDILGIVSPTDESYCSEG